MARTNATATATPAANATPANATPETSTKRLWAGKKTSDKPAAFAKAQAGASSGAGEFYEGAGNGGIEIVGGTVEVVFAHKGKDYFGVTDTNGKDWAVPVWVAIGTEVLPGEKYDFSLTIDTDEDGKTTFDRSCTRHQ